MKKFIINDLSLYVDYYPHDIVIEQENGYDLNTCIYITPEDIPELIKALKKLKKLSDKHYE